jgi:hypothetical protein
MKKILAFLIAILCFVSCFGCTAEKQAETTQNTTSPQDTRPTVSQAAVEALDGKKIIFVGNSYTYYGHCVLRAGSKLEQAPRTNDQGYFYQLCKSRGAEVSVTNWTFGDHSLWESLGESCTREACYGVNHLSYLTDRYFDYVVLQGYNRNFDGDLNEYLKPMMDIFREANPNVKFLFAVPHMVYDRGYAWIPSLQTLDQNAITLCNWGRMLNDVVNGTVQVPGAKQQYIRPTFVVSISEKDGHHQNVLAGYLTAAMVYCAITGESAVGLPYDFCDDSTINKDFDLEAYKEEKYTYEKFTNFIEVFQSPEDMNGLQQLIDQYLKTPL